MIRKVISYFNKTLNFYENLKIVENQSNDDITRSCERYLNMCPPQEATACVGKEIRIIGEFNDEDQELPLISYDHPVIVVDCDKVIKPRIPQLYEQNSN